MGHFLLISMTVIMCWLQLDNKVIKMTLNHMEDVSIKLALVLFFKGPFSATLCF